jgi:hypothetical protein
MQKASWTKLGQLSGADRLLLLSAILLLPLIHGGLLLLGYYRLHRLLEAISPLKRAENTHAESEVIERADHMASILSIAARRGFFRATCLRSSLLLWWLLRWQGVQSEICFGVRKVRDQLEAHAWVEYHGAVLNDLGDIRKLYRAFGEALPPTMMGL